MKIGFIFAFLVCHANLWASTDDIRIQNQQVPCRSAPHPLTRRIFECQTRLQVLAALGIHRLDLRQNFFPAGMEERAMVDKALKEVGSRLEMNGVQKAVYWEELSGII